MSTPALYATRELAPERDGCSFAPPLWGAGEQLAPPLGERGGWRARAPGLAFTLVFHILATAGFAYLWQTMVHDLSEPEGIPVEIVSSVPGEGDKPATTPPPAPAAEKPPQTKPAAPQPSQADILKEALALPAAPPQAQPSVPMPPAPSPTPAPQAGPAPADPPGPVPPAGPPPLAEPPPEPKAAATQTEHNEKANAAHEPDRTAATPAPAPPPPAPDVLTASKGDTGVAAAAPDTGQQSSAAPSDPDDAPAKAATAHLAAALPLSSLGMPSTFRSMLSAQGSSSSQEYKGAVFGALSRIRATMEDQARHRGIKGQVVIMIALSDTGALERASVVQSSGSDATDAFALDMVRRAAPFPPPPPGTPHSFTPAITFGEE